MTTTHTDYPALAGDPVTERHTRTCRESGHAVHVIDGVASDVCPRCGELTGIRLKLHESAPADLFDHVEAPSSSWPVDPNAPLAPAYDQAVYETSRRESSACGL